MQRFAGALSTAAIRLGFHKWLWIPFKASHYVHPSIYHHRWWFTRKKISSQNTVSDIFRVWFFTQVLSYLWSLKIAENFFHSTQCVFMNVSVRHPISFPKWWIAYKLHQNDSIFSSKIEILWFRDHFPFFCRKRSETVVCRCSFTLSQKDECNHLLVTIDIMH